MNSAVVEVNGAQLIQGKKKIVADISLSIFPGELVYLIGKTGAGKTSLLKMLYGDLPFNGSSASVSGFNLKSLNKKQLPYLRRKIGIIFQDFQLLTDRSVEDNLLFVMQATGWRKKSLMAKRFAEVLEQVGLVDKLKKYPHELSGGEQQRVVIARALINEPFVILADEPTGNLDPETSKEIHNILIKITEQGTAMLMATHNYNLIHYHPSRVLEIANERVNEISALNLQF